MKYTVKLKIKATYTPALDGLCIWMMQISSMYIGNEEDFNFILFNHFRSKCPLGTGPWWPLYMNGIQCSHACTLVMGRMLDLPSVIELAPCKYKRVYFYFGVQEELKTY